MKKLLILGAGTAGTIMANKLAPTLVLSYASGGGGTLDFLGRGWSLTQSFIQRDVEYTPDDTSDDTFDLILDGVKHDLVYNPATGEQTGEVGFATVEETNDAVAAAAAAFPAWRATSLAVRSRLMYKFRELVDANRGEIARRISAQHGKTLPDADGEVARAVRDRVSETVVDGERRDCRHDLCDAGQAENPSRFRISAMRSHSRSAT